jgi:hypothetical protein
MDSMQSLIKGLYEQIADQDAILAENNLVGFFRKLEAINKRLLEEGECESVDDRGNEHNHENFRS